MILRSLGAVFLSIAALVAMMPRASAQMATTMTVEAPSRVLVTDVLNVRVKVTFPGNCPASPTPTGGTVTLRSQAATYSSGLEAGVFRTCSNGSYTEVADFNLPTWTPQEYTFSVEYTGTADFAPAKAGPMTSNVLPYLSGSLSNGTAKLSVVGNSDPGFYCAVHDASFHDGVPPSVPAALTLVGGYATYSFTGCSFGCGILCWAHAPRFPLQTITVSMPQPLPATASVWIYAKGSGMTTPVWRNVPATIDGANATFTITGNDGDPALAGTIAIASDSAAARTELQDLWWGGATQNGWGFDISQQGDRLFAALYAYRSDGSPVWVVMPGGTWDATRTVFTGTLYGATGSPYLQYDASRLHAAPSGSAKLTFASTGAATFDYTIGSESGRKSLTRQPVGSTLQPVQGPYAGLWWGGSGQNGWGITIAHQDDTLFAVWYTYDANGNPTWFVMSGGYWSTSTHSPNHAAYGGTLYRTSGSPFLGGAYDPSRLVVTPAGTIGFEFFGTDVAYMSYTIDGHSGYQTLYRQPF